MSQEEEQLPTCTACDVTGRSFTSGPNCKNPNREYWKCVECGKFLCWVGEEKKKWSGKVSNATSPPVVSENRNDTVDLKRKFEQLETKCKEQFEIILLVENRMNQIDERYKKICADLDIVDIVDLKKRVTAAEERIKDYDEVIGTLEENLDDFKLKVKNSVILREN
jgi:hypothetical protein